MTTSRWVIAGVVVLAALSAGIAARLALKRAATFEAAAQRAEAVSAVLTAQAKAQTARVDSLKLVIAHRDSAIARLEGSVATVDSANPIADTCRPNLAVRDSLIRAQRGQILDLRSALGSAAEAFGLVRQANDSLVRALALRPKLYSRFTGPNLGLGAGLGLDPVGVVQGKPLALRLTVGLTLNLGGIHL